MNNEYYTVITGASEGFGKALAFECARRKMNLILTALPDSGLNPLASFIKKNFGVNVYFFEHDLSRKEESCILFNEITREKMRVNMLINNAGIGGTHFFSEKNTEYYHRQIELNVVAPTILSHLFLEILEKNTPAYILNVSSLASYFNLPKKQVYGGTKSFLISFSKSLRKELKKENISVSVVCPGAMNTSPSLIRQHNHLKGIGHWSVMNPDKTAKITIDKLLQKKELIIPGFWNKLFLFIDKFIPGWVSELITERQIKNTRYFKDPIIHSIHPLKPAI